jgi:hypothetical protein
MGGAALAWNRRSTAHFMSGMASPPHTLKILTLLLEFLLG